MNVLRMKHHLEFPMTTFGKLSQIIMVEILLQTLDTCSVIHVPRKIQLASFPPALCHNIVDGDVILSPPTASGRYKQSDSTKALVSCVKDPSIFFWCLNAQHDGNTLIVWFTSVCPL